MLERCPQCSWNPNANSILLFDGQNSTVGAEEFRTLRAHLYLIREREGLQKLLITSPLPQEGKTFAALNLAHAIVRQRERRALLIDSDLRSSGLHLCLGAPLAPGLSDYLSGTADEFSIVQRGSLENLFFIPGGKRVANPSELIGNGRLKLLLQRLAPAFDWIIFDSPPVIPVSDAKVLADLCDGVLLVIGAGSTPYDLAQKACQDLQDKRLLGVVLNRTEPGQAYSSYYYDDSKAKQKRDGLRAEGRKQ